MYQYYRNFQTLVRKSLATFSLLKPCIYQKGAAHPVSHLRMDNEENPQFTVCVEGNIGCGKTTLLNYFSRLKDVEVLHEPVDKWTNLNNHNLLELMYKDPERWSHLFQTYVQLTMMEHHLKPTSKHTKIMERSLYSARHCFVENLYRTGKMSEPEYEVYSEWFKFITSMTDCKVDLIVYLRTDPSILHERIIQRCRKEEAGIPLDYLKSLHDLHEEWIFESASKNATPLLVIDANGSLSQMKDLYIKHEQQIVYGQTPTLPPKGLPKTPNKHKKTSSPVCPKSAAVAN